MSVLYDISRAMVNRGRVSDMIGRTLEILREKLGLLRGTITLREADLLFIEASNGMSDSAVRRGVYRVGEGVTGRVAQEGKSIVIPDISKSSEFLDRTKSRGKSLKGIAFICVPIIYLEQAIGTLSIDVEGKNCAGSDLERYRELLETIANILADAISTIYLRHAETKRLLDENRRLRLKFGGALIRPKNMVGNCGAMQKVYEGMARASAGTDSVLIFGAPGTGKELCAREICSASPDFRKSFHVVNCAALSSEELLCEVFGCEEKYLGLNSPAKHGLLERFFTPSCKPRRSADKVFSDFVSLLSSASPKPRDVAYYADRLCLTPKYLSAVCKQVSGITASQFIAQFVVKDIRRLLEETDKSIKEICNELAFPNPSFFGTYVRKHLGLSPRQYRDRGK